MPLELNRTQSSYSLPAGVAEQTAITLTPSQNILVKGVWLDLVNLTQDITIRVKYQIDGTNARTFQSNLWTTGMEDGVLIEGELPIDDTLTVTLQSSVTEGVSRNIPYEIWWEGTGAGAIEFTYTLTDSVSGDPIAGAEVWVSTTANGSAVIASGITDASGQLVLWLDAGTYFFFRRHNDFSFVNPDSEVVS